jgi:two-component system sensor histidine kinase VicK
VTVADTAVGIPAPVQAELFEKFSPARRPGLRGERSTGLGMSLIKTTVELHLVRISFASTEGQGSTFVSTLPLLAAGQA